MNSLRLFAATVACAALSTPFAGAAAPAESTLACTTPGHGLAERRAIAEAARGKSSLIRFVHRTQPIYQLSLVDTVAMIDAERERRGACTTTSARAISD